MNPLQSLIACGTKLWIDSIDPDLIADNRTWGATGATSNPIIISDLIATGRFDSDMQGFIQESEDNDACMEDYRPACAKGPREIHPRLGAVQRRHWLRQLRIRFVPGGRRPKICAAERTKKYINEGLRWSESHENRMIKVPATQAGLAASGGIGGGWSDTQCHAHLFGAAVHIARDAIWRGAQQRKSRDRFKSVYSIFVSRFDVYTETHAPNLSPAAQGNGGHC